MRMKKMSDETSAYRAACADDRISFVRMLTSVHNALYRGNKNSLGKCRFVAGNPLGVAWKNSFMNRKWFAIEENIPINFAFRVLGGTNLWLEITSFGVIIYRWMQGLPRKKGRKGYILSSYSKQWNKSLLNICKSFFANVWCPLIIRIKLGKDI